MTDLSKLKAEIEQVQRPKTDLGGVLLGRQTDGTEDEGRGAMLNTLQIITFFLSCIIQDLREFCSSLSWSSKPICIST